MAGRTAAAGKASINTRRCLVLAHLGPEPLKRLLTKRQVADNRELFCDRYERAKRKPFGEPRPQVRRAAFVWRCASTPGARLSGRPLGVEQEKHVRERKKLLRRFGYEL